MRLDEILFLILNPQAIDYADNYILNHEMYYLKLDKSIFSIDFVSDECETGLFLCQTHRESSLNSELCWSRFSIFQVIVLYVQPTTFLVQSHSCPNPCTHSQQAAVFNQQADKPIVHYLASTK